jgi:hypothetical protein
MENNEKEGPVVDNTVEKIKIKKPKTKKFEGSDDGITKVNLAKPSENVEQVTKVDLTKPAETAEVIENVVDNTESALEDITNEVVDTKEQTINEPITDVAPLREDLQKLVAFMEETGGDMNDYIKLNKDYSNMDNLTLLKEYYKESKPHLTSDEIEFLMEDQFSYEEDVDDEKDIKKKKIALKEQVANAKSHLDGLKSKYYNEIKAGSKLTSEQQKAIDFFNRYNKESEESTKMAEKTKSRFLNKTKEVFNNEFKGFEYNVGDKNYRFKVNNANEVRDTQSDINNFIKKFLNEENQMEDAKGYHKSLYTAMNADAIAKHFYEQGKADAMQDSIKNAKNIDMSPRQSFGEVNAGGLKVRVLGEDSNDFKFKIKKNK